MISTESVFLLALLSIFAGFAVVLFKMLDSKPDKLDTDVSTAYAHVRKHVLDPILGEIFSSKKGKYKPTEFFNTPEVVLKLSEYRAQLFKYNRVYEIRSSVLLMLDFTFKTTLCLVTVIIITILANEIFINSDYNTFEITMSHILLLVGIVLIILTTFLILFIKKFMSFNASFKTQITELKGGLP